MSHHFAPPLRLYFAIFIGLLFAGTNAAERLIPWVDAKLDDDFAKARFLILCILSAVYGIYRVIAAHPFYRPPYRRWLAQTPWSLGKPLPLGSVLLNWQDFAVVGVFVALPLLDGISRKAWLWAAFTIIVLFTGSYLITLGRTLRSERGILFYCLAILPLTVYPGFERFVTLAGLALIYVLMVIGTRRVLGRFPWDDPEWTTEPKELYLREATKRGLLGWPFTAVGPRLKFPPQTIMTVCALSFLAAWWAHAAMGTAVFLFSDFGQLNNAKVWRALVQLLADPQIQKGESTFLSSLWRAFCVLIAVVRLSKYIAGCAPPTSVFARIATGQLIMPRYDQIFVAPLCILLFGWWGPLLLWKLGLPPVLLPALCVGIIVLMAVGMGPTLELWKFTGQYRAFTVPTGRTQAQQQPHAAQIQIKPFE